MAYTQGGLIQAADYNTLVGSSPGSSPTSLNTVWSVGSGSAGWGQTAVSQAAATAGLITATQWASLVNTVNSANLHINGSGSGLTANTAGQVIGYSGSLQTTINGLNNDRLKFASNSAAIAGSPLAATWTAATTSATLTRSFGARATFASADQARYFFNAGGRLKLNVSGAQSASTTARTNAAIALCTNLGGLAIFGANTNGGRTGTLGTASTNDTTKGYWTSTYNGNVTIVSVTSVTTSYTSDTATISANVNGAQGSNNSNGNQVDFWTTLNSTSGANAGSLSFDDSIGITVTSSIDVSYPEVTNISNTWGAVVISQI